jgi:IS5 family transposase
MEKNITFPTDAKLQYKAMKRLVKMAKASGIQLHQTYLRIGRRRLIQAGRYAHARQMKRAQKERKKLKTYLGRLYRTIQKHVEENSVLNCVFQETFEMVDKLLKQTRHSKDKIYSLHEPYVDCISKGKAHKKYEFGCKASFVITHREGLALGAMAFHKNPYDGHTLKTALEDAEKQSKCRIDRAYVDKGYKGHKINDTKIFMSGQKRLTNWFKKRLKRRQAIEPHIGHMKYDGKLGRNYLQGKLGDYLNVVLCGIGHNLRIVSRHLLKMSLVPT